MLIRIVWYLDDLDRFCRRFHGYGASASRVLGEV